MEVEVETRVSLLENILTTLSRKITDLHFHRIDPTQGKFLFYTHYHFHFTSTNSGDSLLVANSTLLFSRYQVSEDQWKRRKGMESESVKSEDERQIIRVAQQQQQSQQSSQSAQSGKQQFHSVEPVSPPEATTNHYARRFYETATATTTSGTPSNKHSLSPLDYVKNKIVEVMRTSEDDKGGTTERNGGGGGGGGGPEKDDKPGVGSPAGGEILIDENPNPPQNQPPVPAPTTFYPFSALGVHTGPPPAPPPSSSTPASLPKPEPAPLLSAQYEPLSDED